MDASNGVEVVEVPKKRRILKALCIVIPTLTLAIVAFIDLEWVKGLFWLIGGLVFAFFLDEKEIRNYQGEWKTVDYPNGAKTREFRYTAVGAAAKARDEEVLQSKSLANEGKFWETLNIWWVRYPLAIAIGLLSLWLFESDGKIRILWGVIAAGYALYLARELALVGLGIAAIVWLFNLKINIGIPEAIIIGAFIIAAAVSANRK